MYIETVRNRNSPPAILLREGWREGKKVHKRTLANLSKLPAHVIELIRRTLKGETFVAATEAFEVVSSLHHGHVEAVRAAMKRLRFDELIASRPSRERNLVEAMVVARILQPDSKLATTRCWHTTTLPEVLDVADVDEDDLYAAMDWLLERQERIEKKLAARHLKQEGLVLYDLSSSYFEGVTCPLAALGHNRDGKKGKLQVNYGLLAEQRGCPVAVSVFEGNTSDSKTLMPQIEMAKNKFNIKSIVLVGDRGMISQKRIDDDLRNIEGVDWITALKSASISKLVKKGQLQLDLFDERNLFELTHPDFEGERLMACRNPGLAKLRAHKRQSLLDATTKELTKLQAMVERGKLRGKNTIESRMSKVVAPSMNKYFVFDIDDDRAGFEISDTEAAKKMALDNLRKRLESLRTEIERGTLKGKDKIDSRVRRVIGKELSQHVELDIHDESFHFRIVNEATASEDILNSVCKRLESICSEVRLGKYGGLDNIAVRIGKVINKYKVAKHFVLDVREDGFTFQLDEDKIASEAALDGIYIVRTSVPAERLSAEDVVRSYKSLSQVERAFRSFKSVDLKVRPIHHRLETRVRAHIFLCMLAYYVEWHMREAWRPLLFCDENQEAKKTRDPVAPATRSEAAQRKVQSKRLDDGSEVHSFQTLLKGLSTIVRNVCRVQSDDPDDASMFHVATIPDPTQQRAYDLLKAITV